MTRFPEALATYDDPVGLFREHLLPGHAPTQPLLKPGDSVLTLGSCFAKELREVLEIADFESSSVWVPAGLNNTFALRDFITWALSGSPTASAYRYERQSDGTIAEWQPHVERAVFEDAFAKAQAMVFTLGLAEVWVDRVTGHVFWRGVPEHVYDEQRHELRLSTVPENEANLRAIIETVRGANPDVVVVLTLSPVPLRATFRDMSCVTADCVSKSVLRVAIDNVLEDPPANVFYWPSFELVRWAGACFDWRAYQGDSRHPRRFLIQTVVELFVDTFYGNEAGQLLRSRLRERGESYHAPKRVQARIARRVRQARRAPSHIKGLLARLSMPPIGAKAPSPGASRQR